jgi:hypothetical protein
MDVPMTSLLDSPATPCFILGIAPRSGTNYLYRLLGRHPDCRAPGPIWEDFLLHHADLLACYAARVVGSWDPRWGAAEAVGGEDAVLHELGDGLLRLLGRQLREEDDAAGRVFLTKTPSVGGLDHFMRLFPAARALVLVRDGRALVESGVRSFGWRYEDAMRRWADAATQIAAFLERHRGLDSPVRLVRYEDLVAAEARTLTEIFGFLGLDPARYDFAGAREMGVTGSSELRSSGQIHWKTVERRADFDPLRRHAHWPRARHERFVWLAGPQMEALGYASAAPHARPRSARQRALDVLWPLYRRARSLAAACRRRLAPGAAPHPGRPVF